ncbi:MAG: hypothetical protein CL565_06625 [Alphaproteobacteria bacterium]|nr:hypothetical protein [Alphaproteobacteria bacterium]|tara:strand:- start:566 stop:1669 length:1104 start_codon:yes stop_codon:yes gene_type:complete
MAITATQEREPQIQQPAPAVAAAPPAASIRPETAVAGPPPESSIRTEQPDAEAQLRDDRMDRHNEHDQATLRQRAYEEAQANARAEGREMTPEETALLDESVERTQQVADRMPDMVTENIGMGIFMTIIMEVFGLGQANGNSLEGMNIEGLIGQMFSSLIPGLGVAGAGMAAGAGHDHDGPSIEGGSTFSSDGNVTLQFPIKGDYRTGQDIVHRGGSRMHEGGDYPVPTGTDLYAAAEGRVHNVGNDADGWGKYIDIDHGNGLFTRYAHLSDVDVREGQTVGPDTVIGQSGSTGRSSGPHLHFEVGIADGNGRYQIVSPASAMGQNLGDSSVRQGLINEARESYQQAGLGHKQGMNATPEYHGPVIS